MTRYVLVRDAGGIDQAVPEGQLPAEAHLHDALTTHPQLLPTEDFGFGATVVIGREAILASGYADLVLVDERGQLCLVEVKKEGNPDTRQVVAQLLDYAGAIWGQTLNEFETSVLRPFVKSQLGGQGPASLHEFLEERFGQASDQPDSADDRLPVGRSIDAIEAGLAATLESGRFVLVVAAPEIPPGVRRAIEYLNAQGMRLFAVEISYFARPVEVFVPRIVVSPPAEVRLGGSRTTAEPIDRESFLAALPTKIGSFASGLLDQSVELGAEVTWNPTGATVKVRGPSGLASLVQFETQRMYLMLAPAGGFPKELYDQYRAALEGLGLGGETESKGFRRIDYGWIDESRDLADLRQVIVQMCESLASHVRVPSVDLEPPVTADFERNDYNIWESVVPALKEYRGRHLWGSLMRVDSGDYAALQLVPLRGGAPGWLPRFFDRAKGAAVWPSGEYSGTFALELSKVELSQ